MACRDCFRKNIDKLEFVPGTCEVCVLTNNDSSEKQVHYCEFCKANICKACWRNYGKRLNAMFRRFFRSGILK